MCIYMSCFYTASATGYMYTEGSFSQSVGTVFQRLMDTCQLNTTAQASEPKKEDAVSLSPPPGVVNHYGCKANTVQRSNSRSSIGFQAC